MDGCKPIVFFLDLSRTLSLTILFQISKALKQFTEHSLIVLDEFGKGTDSVCLGKLNLISHA